MQRSDQLKESSVSHTLSCRDYKSATDLIVNNNCSLVRKLTPLECERLHGLPDDYTNVSINCKNPSDSVRFMTIGNGMAQPCADRVINRIVNIVKLQTLEVDKI